MIHLLALIFCLIPLPSFTAEKVSIQGNQLVVDGTPQPQLFGAEIQYFRLRGGQAKNIPRARVLEIWNRALDHAVAAGMNTVSFYIPWDFHEYKEGHFDFTGTVDEDGDGNADYPSRDVITFLKLIEQKGITRIMARPGPYINAEWGFLGFGAIPLWFHQKYPDSHMQNSGGLKTKLYDYHSPDLLRHTRIWFQTVYREVLKDKIGANGPILFLQLDNETNFMWQSIFNHDYGPRALSRYQEFLRANYLFIEDLNLAHHTSWTSWSEVKPPVIPGLNVNQDRAWYQFQDNSIYTYLKKLRIIWEEIGVREPQVIFTLAESYNAMKNGILPNFKLRNARSETGMMTMNLYPKTYQLPSNPLMNLPFKADHDVKAMDAASDSYLGSKQEWLLGPEIQGGWWRNTPVSSESRQQTYLSTIGHGLKALYIYYFTEGDNWQAGWAREQILPLYQTLRTTPDFANTPDGSLPDAFWKKLQIEVDQKVIVGMDVWRIMNDAEASSDTLFFDAPLDHEARPSTPYALLKDIGAKLIQPHQDFLSEAVRVTDDVVIMKDLQSHAPSPVTGIDSMLMNAEWSGGLLGYLSQSGLAPDIHHWGLNNRHELDATKIIFHQDSGITDPELTAFYTRFMNKGGTVVTTLGHSLAHSLKLPFIAEQITSIIPIKVRSIDNTLFDAAPAPLHQYVLTDGKCAPLLWSNQKVMAFKCQQGKGSFIQIGALFYDIYNSDWYGVINDNKHRVAFLESILKEINLTPQLKIKDADQVVAFARMVKGKGLWITAKNGKRAAFQSTLQISEVLLRLALKSIKRVKVSLLMKGESSNAQVTDGLGLNLPLALSSEGSEVYFIQAADD